jgi:hypothetical protein
MRRANRMNETNKGRSPGDEDRPSGINTLHGTDRDQRTPDDRPVVAFGFAAAPAGRRTKWALVIPQCPHCFRLHLHRADGPRGGLRIGSCGRVYRVQLAGWRRRGAA